MKPNLFLLRMATCCFLTFSSHAFAIEVQNAVVVDGERGLSRTYAFTTDGKPDDRFKFIALRASEDFWDLSILPSDMSDWSAKLSFKEYTGVIYRCVDRFLSDVPNAGVFRVHICLTHDSKTWQTIKKKLVSDLEKRTGSVIGFSGADMGTVDQALILSPEINEIGWHLAKRFKRKFDYSLLDADDLHIRESARGRTWQDVAKLPDLAIDIASLQFTMDFKAISKATKK